MEDIIGDYTNYDTAVYRLILDEHRRYVKKISKSICYPKNDISAIYFNEWIQTLYIMKKLLNYL